MKTRLVTIILLLVILRVQLKAQGTLPTGRFKVIETSGGHLWDLDSDRITCILADSAESFQNDQYLFWFFEDTLIEETYHFSIDPGDGTVLSSNSNSIRKIKPIAMARGASWFFAARNCLHSRYYSQVGDSLWLNTMTEGELPIGFEIGRTRLIDTLGLQVLLPVLRCIAGNSKYAHIDILIDDPDVIRHRKKDFRLAARRLTILQEQLRLGLGDTYTRIQFLDSKSGGKATKYTVSYRIH
jgi:hypothetical protein